MSLKVHLKGITRFSVNARLQDLIEVSHEWKTKFIQIVHFCKGLTQPNAGNNCHHLHKKFYGQT